jgi:hypothetical protein
MARFFNLFGVSKANAAAGNAGDLPGNLTDLGLEDLMNLSIGRRSGVDAADLGELDEGQAALSDDLLDELPEDLTTLSLGQLLNLRVRANKADDEDKDEDVQQAADQNEGDDKDDDEDEKDDADDGAPKTRKTTRTTARP